MLEGEQAKNLFGSCMESCSYILPWKTALFARRSHVTLLVPPLTFTQLLLLLSLTHLNAGAIKQGSVTRPFRRQQVQSHRRQGAGVEVRCQRARHPEHGFPINPVQALIIAMLRSTPRSEAQRCSRRAVSAAATSTGQRAPRASLPPPLPRAAGSGLAPGSLTVDAGRDPALPQQQRGRNAEPGRSPRHGGAGGGAAAAAGICSPRFGAARIGRWRRRAAGRCLFCITVTDFRLQQGGGRRVSSARAEARAKREHP